MSFRHGREEDEIMGVSFKKDLVVDRVQVFPKGQDDKNNKLQVIHMKVICIQTAVISGFKIRILFIIL